MARHSTRKIRCSKDLTRNWKICSVSFAAIPKDWFVIVESGCQLDDQSDQLNR